VWAEARSRIVVEAMLRGVPVVASNTGGLPEAKLGVPYTLSVNPIQSYQRKLDAKMVPVATAPAQDLEPWVDAVLKLTSDEAHWNEISSRSRSAAHEYFERTLRVEPFEDFVRKASISTATDPVAQVPDKERLRLLALRLREQWLTPPDLHQDELNLLCFPYAGAGPVAFRHWRDKLPAFTVRYPDKADSLETVVNALMQHVAPKLKGAFAFFGHSMGAGIAFEFARSLRGAGLPEPFALLVSAATAPQLRTTVAPDPTDDELIAVLARIHRRDPADPALRVLLPRFAPDAKLHRRYLYREEPPLEIPIRAYGGEDDAAVPLERLEPWKRQTTRSFALRLFPGSHMYLDDPQAGLLSALKEDLDELMPR
jgi:surfactin synthase thioesterase subunit